MEGEEGVWLRLWLIPLAGKPPWVTAKGFKEGDGWDRAIETDGGAPRLEKGPPAGASPIVCVRALVRLVLMRSVARAGVLGQAGQQTRRQSGPHEMEMRVRSCSRFRSLVNCACCAPQCSGHPARELRRLQARIMMRVPGCGRIRMEPASR